jgi:hypothetical protein
MAEQLQKYVVRKRMDPDFDVNKIGENESAEVLWHQMLKTFRTDMKRRNDVWNLVGEYLTKLEKSVSPKDIFTFVDRLNSCVHNTNTLILGKASDGTALMQAYNAAHNHDPKYWKQYVNKDLKQLIDQESMNEAINPMDRENVKFMTGVKLGIQDKAHNVQRDMSKYEDDFVRGYQSVKKDSWWSKTNDKLSQWASELGNSYGKHF